MLKLIKWSDEQLKFKDSVQQLADALNEDLVDGDNKGEFPKKKWDLLCEMDFPAFPIQEKYGGIGLDLITTMFLLESLGNVCEDGGLNFSLISHMVSTEIPIQKFGTDEQKARYLPDLSTGNIIGAHAITEPDNGSDAFNMNTFAEKSGSDFILNGNKTFISNGPIADLFVIYAMTDQIKGSLGGITAFLVERSNENIQFGESIDKMGLRTSPFGEIFLDDCVVPENRVLHKVGSGFSVFNYVMKWEILLSFAVHLGEMERQLTKCIEYSKQRKQFGKPISKFQSISNKIADMKVRLETSRLLLYKAGQLFQERRSFNLDLAICKLYISESYVQSSLEAIQIFGAYGYSKECLIEKDLRNSVASRIYSGTSEIQRNMIANQLGL